MAIKTFKTFSDLDLGESLIGGVRRHLEVTLPERVPPHTRMIVPTDADSVATFSAALGTKRLVLEVGSGKGRFLTTMAAQAPESIFLGCETRLKFARWTVDRADRAGAINCFMTWGDARATIPTLVPDGRASEAYLLFPDPWWKRKHADRRHGTMMAEALANALAQGARLVIKSDVEGYLDQIVESFLSIGMFIPASPPAEMVMTDRETRLVRDGTKIFTAAMTKG